MYATQLGFYVLMHKLSEFLYRLSETLYQYSGELEYKSDLLVNNLRRKNGYQLYRDPITGALGGDDEDFPVR